MSRKFSIKFTARDRDLLGALAISPFDARQLAKLSATFAHPFTDEKFVRRRMQSLAAAGLVAHFQYLTATAGAVKYYKLTHAGYRMLAGPGKQLPRRAFFNAVSPSLQNHTRLLADFIVKTLASAHANSIRVNRFYGENQLELKLGKRSMRLDAAAEFKIKGYRPYLCYFEIDCGSEPVYSSKQRESLAQKIRFIYDYQAKGHTAFRHYVLFATDGPRMTNYLGMVKELNPNPTRPICHATNLKSYLTTDEPLRALVLKSRQDARKSILPNRQNVLPPNALEHV